jgi:hypothetical protein
MLSQKYFKEFLNKKDHDLKAVLNRIVEQEKVSGISFLEWSENEIGEYLRSFKSVSAMALNRQLSVLRNFADFICEKENIAKRSYDLGEDKLNDFIDKTELLQVTINYEQYRHIKNQLDDNVRDKLLFELPWYGLTNAMIKMLKNSDIQFVYSEDFGWEIALLSCRNLNEESEDEGEEVIDTTSNEPLIIKIEDPEVVEDIKKCMKESWHIIESKDGRVKKMQYRDSDYLIKPINVGKSKKEDYLCNPSLTLQKTFVTKYITCEGINMNKLSIANIRRSGLIYLLSPENEKDFSLELISVLYGYKNDSGLYWLRNFAKEKYKNN